jgi:hypothetical protein
MNILIRLLLTLLLCSVAITLCAKEKLPEKTKDGLVLQHHTKLGAVYLKPGATLTDYDEVKILDCFVAFQKNWKRNFNNEQQGLEGRVTDQEMQKIKTEVAEVFKESFTKALDKAGYTVVDTTGPKVLLIRPAIIDLTVTAPDIPTAGMNTNIVSSSGTMTLYAELYDSQTSAKIAEVVDAEEAGQNSFAHRANSVTNRQAFERTTDAWAKILVKRLDEAHGKTGK